MAAAAWWWTWPLRSSAHSPAARERFPVRPRRLTEAEPSSPPPTFNAVVYISF
ncbi:hypothetical protein PENSPDRAFT_645866 [Peniophora sp. CONT]|nr:hypothetical protein PENSPDRAFT_645866 [Peniophora sp. CONT]